MHEVLVNRLGGLSLPRKSVVRLTDRADMILDVYRGRKTTLQRQHCYVRIRVYVTLKKKQKKTPFINSKTGIWRKSHRSQITLSAEGISDNIARQVKLTPDAFGSLRHVRRIHQVAAFEKCPQARKKD